MNKTYKNIIIGVLIVLLGYIAFNFERFFIIPKYRAPIIDNMIDPTSVLFKNEKIHGKFLCGEFNSKNRMGAYTGFNRFISNPTKALLADNELRNGVYNALGEIDFEIAIQEALKKDKKSYDEYYLVKNEYEAKVNAKQFSSLEEYKEAKSTFEKTEFTIHWNSICK